MTNKHHQIAIIGGGSAGITVAAALLRKDKNLDVAIIEPSERHYYQPGWTLVGAGILDIKDTEKNEKDLIPENAHWIKEYASKLLPDENKVILRSGEEIAYDYLVVCPGIQISWNKIKGLKESLGKNDVCCNYSPDFAPYTYECIKNFKGGTALFTQPNTPLKCGGATQKVMYLASDYFKKRGLLGKADVRFVTAAGEIFGIKIFADTLTKVVQRYDIKIHFHHNLKEIKGEAKEAVFDILKDGQPVSEVAMKYDMMHVTPPMSAPDFIKESPLANQAGWLDLHRDTLQHTRYTNVFGLGDASGTPNAKTCAAIRKQTPVVVNNLLQYIERGSILNAVKYNGYGSCPIATGYGKLLLIEFDYDKKPTPTFPLDPSKERYSMWLLKRYFLPWFYWNRMLKGKP
ncbi:MAG: FAD/NAD(P)-binding oxidoreductase [Candidatus Brocadiaceae bacterium]